MNFLKNIGSLAANAVSSKPAERPAFEVIRKQDGYEERNYPPAKWVSTTLKTTSRSKAIGDSFWKLFSYLQGENERGIKMEMTSPVVAFVPVGNEESSQVTTVVSFYIPRDQQHDPPKPNNPEVFVKQWPEQYLFVRTFGGFANDAEHARQAAELMELLKNNGEPYVAESYYTAGYDPPFKLMNRTNEIWAVRKMI